jgi:hypothetical protein
VAAKSPTQREQANSRTDRDNPAGPAHQQINIIDDSGGEHLSYSYYYSPTIQGHGPLVFWVRNKSITAKTIL